MNFNNYIERLYNYTKHYLSHSVRDLTIKIKTYLQSITKSKIHNIHNIHNINNIHNLFTRKQTTEAFGLFYKTYLIHYIDMLIFIDNITRKLNSIRLKIINKFLKCVPSHVLYILYFDINKYKITLLLPVLYLFKYYRIPKKSHTQYYSITVWSTTELKYKSLFIDAVILSELENKYVNLSNPYTISNILALLKYKNNIKYIDLGLGTYHIYDKLNKYYQSFAIPNNITGNSLKLLYLYLYNFPLDFLLDLIDFNNEIINNSKIKIFHNNGYVTTFSNDEVMFSSLDVNIID